MEVKVLLGHGCRGGFSHCNLCNESRKLPPEDSHDFNFGTILRLGEHDVTQLHSPTQQLENVHSESCVDWLEGLASVSRTCKEILRRKLIFWAFDFFQSHHLYPNSYSDFEISAYEPYFSWIPIQKKTRLSILFSYLATPFVYAFLFHGTLTLRYGLSC